MKIRSYIKCILAGVMLFSLAACVESVGEFFGLEDRERISFTATIDETLEDITRAAIDEDSYATPFVNTQPKKPLVLSSAVTKRDAETTRGHRFGDNPDDELSAFRVSAFLTNKNVSVEEFSALFPNFFYNLKAKKNTDGIYEIDHQYYWPSSSDKLWFYAYAPCDDSNVQISSQTQSGPQKVSFTVDTNVANQIDLMTADAATTSFSSASGETTKTSVALNFRHELTAIRFVIGEQWLAGSIKSIGIYNVHGKGTMTIGADDATKWEWKNKAGNAVAATDDFVLTVDKGGLSGTEGEEIIEDPSLYFLMIPQSFDDNNDAYIEVKYQDNAREYTVKAPLKGLSAWERNTTVTYAISSHELTKLKIGTISWPDATGDDAWNGPKTDFAAGDEVGLYVVDPDGQTIQEHYRNVRCSYDGEAWTVHHPEDYPVYKLRNYQYFFYYPYTPTPDTTYPVAGQNNTNTAATAFFSHLINGWHPAAVQNTSLATLNAQDLQVAKGVDDEQQKSTVNATMAHQMNLAKLKLGENSVTDTWVYPVDKGTYTWNYKPDSRSQTASSNFSLNLPYLHTDAYYYFVFAPVETNTDTGVLLKGLNAQGTETDWSWELKTQNRGKLLTHTAISSDTGKNVMHNNELAIAQISALTATGSALTIPVNVTVNSKALTQGTDYTVSYKNSSNAAVTSISTAGSYTAYISPKGRYSGDAVPRAFTVNKASKTISFANTSVSKSYGDAAFTQTVTNTGTGTVTYSSGNTSVATVNSTSGQVTIKAAGSAVITATVADSEYDTYSTKTATYTLTVKKAASSVTKAPTAKSLTYTGSAQALVNAGTASGGTMQYSLDNSTWSTSIPTGTNAGSYTVYYKVVGDANHGDVDSKSVAVTIAKAASSVTTAPTAKSGLTYTGSAQALVTAGAASGGTMKYSTDNSTWATSIPKGTNAGSYTVYYMVTGDANHTDVASKSVKVTIAKAAASVTTAPTAKTDLAYTGSAQALVTAGAASGGTMKYSTDNSTWATSVPKGTNAGSYTVYYMVTGDANHTDVASKSVKVTIAKVAGNITLSATSGSVKYGATSTFTVSSSHGGTLSVTPTDNTNDYVNATISGTTVTLKGRAVTSTQQTVTVTCAATTNYNKATATYKVTVSKAAASVTTAPTAKDLTYTGSAQALVNAGAASGGTLKYSTDNATWATSIPKGTNAGSYTVYYMVTGDANHTDVASKSVKVTIAKAAASVTTAPTAKSGLAYTGSAQALVNAGTASGGTMKYSTDNSTWATSVPKGTNAGSYTVYYMVDGDANHSDVASKSVKVTIAKVAGNITLSATSGSVKYGATSTFTVSSSHGGTLSVTPTDNTNDYVNATISGTTVTLKGRAVTSTQQTVTVTCAATTNYNKATATYKVTVSKAAASVTTAPTAKTGLTYTGSAQALVNAGAASGGTLKYSTDNATWATSIPKGTNAGSYTVYYMVAGDANHSDVASKSVKVTIAKAASSVTTAPTAKTGLTYTGSAQALVTAGAASGGTMKYSTDNSTWATSVPKGTNAGSYTVYYMVTGDANHSDVASKSVKVTIAKASSSMSNGSGAVSFTSSQGANSTISRTITCTNCSVSGVSVASGSGFSVSHSGNTVTIKRTTADAFSGKVTVTGTGNTNYNNPSNITISVSGVATPANGHAYVDLGNPSCYYATMNVGASSEGAWGSYFAWGETTTKSSYTSSSYTASSISTNLSTSQDAARKQWGGAWRMPTKAELQWLVDNCTWTWTTSGGNNGCRITSNISGYTSKSIFLPAAGVIGDSGFSYRGSMGFYWSSTYFDSNQAWDLIFASTNWYPRPDMRYFGLPVRAVLSK